MLHHVMLLAYVLAPLADYLILSANNPPDNKMPAWLDLVLGVLQDEEAPLNCRLFLIKAILHVEARHSVALQRGQEVKQQENEQQEQLAIGHQEPEQAATEAVKVSNECAPEKPSVVEYA